ncbi:MAG: exodeoxyribonuclease VII small subunit [Spirochaetae bacterium HGW-Spirochaetae-9]|nr:MAG: exodeoxyribonuclease VII small subunit [Spirochaetae bacterium HGW-Spirochaetae-9]
MKDFESRLGRLEFLAERIKDQDLPLEDAIKVFEEGIKLSKGLKKELEKIQGKVEILINAPESVEKPEVSLFDSTKDD